MKLKWKSRGEGAGWDAEHPGTGYKVQIRPTGHMNEHRIYILQHGVALRKWTMYGSHRERVAEAERVALAMMLGREP